MNLLWLAEWFGLSDGGFRAGLCMLWVCVYDDFLVHAMTNENPIKLVPRLTILVLVFPMLMQ